jgi:hypothetical protein
VRDRVALLYLGACTLRAAHPAWSPDLCLAHADDLLRAAERGVERGGFPDQHITPPAEPNPWDSATPFERPRGAEVVA